MKRLTLIVLSTVAIMSLFFPNISFASGGDMGGTDPNGSESHPYLIEDLADFDVFAGDSNYWASGVHTKLTIDINLSGRTYTTAVIAADMDNTFYYVFDGTPFRGLFNGNGYRITGLTINGGTSTDYAGLFGNIGGGGKIENLGIVNCTISGDFCVATLAGSNSGTITKCYSTGTVTGNNYFIGGLTGRNGGSIIYSYSNTTVINGVNYIGGLVGENGGTIIGSYATGQVQARSVSGYVGGLVGDNYEGNITHCYSTGYRRRLWSCWCIDRWLCWRQYQQLLLFGYGWSK